MSSPQELKFCPYCGGSLEWKTAHGRERPVCVECGRVLFQDPKVAVVLFLVSEGKVLLVRRGIVPEQGRWTLLAGYVDAGEDPRDTVVRECREETGLDVKVTSLIDVFPSDEHPGGADIIIVFQGELIGGELEASDDAWEAGWFPPDSLPRLGFRVTKDLVSEWAMGERRHSGDAAHT